MELANEYELTLVGKFRKTVWSKFLKGIKDYELIKPNDKIAVCISGGKDSMLMAMCMKRLQRYSKIPVWTPATTKRTAGVSRKMRQSLKYR